MGQDLQITDKVIMQPLDLEVEDLGRGFLNLDVLDGQQGAVTGDQEVADLKLRRFDPTP